MAEQRSSVPPDPTKTAATQRTSPRAERAIKTERCSRRRSAGGDGGTTLFRSARSDEDGGNPANIAASGASNQNRAMFAPPICRRRWRNNALPFRQIRRRRRQPSEHRRERSEQSKQSDVRAADLQEEMAEQRSSVPPDPTKTAATQRTSPRAERAIKTERCSRRRSAGGDGGTTLFRSARSDEDGGNPANIAASGASNQNRAMFAPPICRRRWRNNALPFRQIRRRRRQPSEHRRERSEQSKQSAMPEQLKKRAWRAHEGPADIRQRRIRR